MQWNKDLLLWIKEHAEEIPDVEEGKIDFKPWFHESYDFHLIHSGIGPIPSAQLAYFLVHPIGADWGWERFLELWNVGAIPEMRDIDLPMNVIWPEGGPDHIDCDTFRFCPGLQSITINKKYMDTIGARAFLNCTNLTSVNIKSCGSLYESAFEGCTGLTEVILPDGLSFISNNVFYNCKNLKILEIPDTITYIGNHSIGLATSTGSGSTGGKVKIRVRGKTKEEAHKFLDTTPYFEGKKIKALWLSKVID